MHHLNFRLDRVENTNERLKCCLDVARARYKIMSKRTAEDTRILIELRKDLTKIFKQIHLIKKQVSVEYPGVFRAVGEAMEKEQRNAKRLNEDLKNCSDAASKQLAANIERAEEASTSQVDLGSRINAVHGHCRQAQADSEFSDKVPPEKNSLKSSPLTVDSVESATESNQELKSTDVQPDLGQENS